jgi:hypothetical protein
MKRWIGMPFVMLAAACTPPEQTYCNGFGLPQGNPEYQKCLSYYFQQESAFGADRQACEFEADKTYPPTLYDRGRYERVYGGVGYGHYGYDGGFGTTVYVEPDYYHNREVDGLRMRIIQPCMESKGWNSGETWQAGRKAAGKLGKPMPQPATKLPWLK